MAIIDLSQHPGVWVQTDDGVSRSMLIDTNELRHVTGICVLSGSDSAALGFEFLYDGGTYVIEGKNLKKRGVLTGRYLTDPQKYDSDLVNFHRIMKDHTH